VLSDEPVNSATKAPDAAELYYNATTDSWAPKLMRVSEFAVNLLYIGD
jgi:hypothetical protein